MTIDRRAFVTWAAGGAFVLAAGPLISRAGTQAPEARLSPWLRIAPDGRVTLVSTVSEMGQGSRTGQAQILADELDVAWEMVSVEMAPDTDPFRVDGGLYSGGSESIRTRWNILRAAGATARAQLIAAAAARWNVPADSCAAALGRVTHTPTGRVLDYGALAGEAAAIPPPAAPSFKAPSQRRYIGKSLRTLGLSDKVDGAARYGIDVRLPGMARATVRACPMFGGTLAGVDEAPAMKIAGVRRVVRLPTAVAVVADTTWVAFRGARALDPQWTPPADPAHSGDLVQRLTQALDAPGAEVASKPGSDPATARRAVRASFAAAARKVEATYAVPYLSHSPMEPMNATAVVTADRVEIHAPCQDITQLRTDVAKALNRPIEQVSVTVTLLGGGFGRRLATDYAVLAALVAQAHGGPVQLVWTREEDMTHDVYRPASLNRFRATLGPDGLIEGYEIVGATTDDVATSGTGPAPYRIAGFANTQTRFKAGVPVGSWRSVDPGITTFGRESFVDECAAAAGEDPLAYRRRLVGDNARARRVLDAAAEAIGWGAARPPGTGAGLALFQGWETVISHAVEVATVDGRLRVTRMVVAGDPGTVINPDQVRAQWEGGALMGLSAAMGEAMTFSGGAAEQKNFDAYKLLRMAAAPTVEVLLFETPSAPIGGVGEPPVPGAAAALGNAVFAATGQRIRTLPFSAHGLFA
jgi:isoquinoline 1-oxidoreductase beta subunit